MKKKIIFCIILLMIGGVSIYYITKAGATLVENVQRENIKEESIVVSEWFVSQFTDSPLTLPTLDHFEESATKELKDLIEEDRGRKYFPIQDYVDYVQDYDVQVSSAPDSDDTEGEESTDYDFITNPLNLTKEQLQSLRQLEEELKSENISESFVKEKQEQDSRIIKVADRDVIPLVELNFKEGKDYVYYNDRYYVLTRDTVPLSFDEKVASASYKFKYTTSAYSDNIFGVVYTSLDSKRILRLQFKRQGSKVVKVTVTEASTNQ